MATAALFVAGADAATARDLTVVARSEALGTILSEAYLRPFSAVTDLGTVAASWDGGLDTLRDQLKNPENAWDLVLLDPDELATGCIEGLFEKTDWTAVGGKDRYQAWALSDCGVGAMLTNAFGRDDTLSPLTPANI